MKEKFAIFSPVSGIQKNVPIILTLTPDNINALLKDGKILRRKMREATLLNAGAKVQTPDANPIIHYHRFVKRSTGTEYLLAFTKAHIYHWNPDDLTLDLKFTCSADCDNWETVSYNDNVIATNNVDKVLVWDTTGLFVALDDETNGIEYSRAYSNETAVDETSAADQKVLKVAATTGYAADDKVIINRGGDREEEAVVFSVQAGISLTFDDNLTYEHTADTKTTVDDDSADAQKVLNVASTTGFSVGELVTINAGGDRAETRKIYTIQAGISLTMTVDLSYTHTQAQGDEVVGSAGAEDTVEEYTPYYLTKAKHLTVFENFLHLGNTYENGTYHYQRDRWNSIGEEANWLSGTSGSMEVGQSDKITGFGHYQGFLFIFKGESYFKVWLVGLPYIFNKVRLSTEIGCQCSASIVNDSKGRLYFYSSEGTFKEISAGTISDDIQTDIVAKIQPAYVHLIKSAFLNETEEILWSIPVESDKNNTLVAYKEGKWLIIDSAVPAFGECKEV
ncbi:MAG TPA: hypothetical protein VMV86_04935 [Methanosarcinales archaeon]|nr:hypothetical protein [Methanosarcinales archaeon]